MRTSDQSLLSRATSAGAAPASRLARLTASLPWPPRMQLPSSSADSARRSSSVPSSRQLSGRMLAGIRLSPALD